MAGPSNPETLRRMYDAFASRDLDAFLVHCAPDVQIDSDIGSYPAGHDGIRGWWRDLTEAFAIGSPQVDLMADLGDVVLSFLTGLWRGHTSGVEFEAERIHLTRWRDGMAVWWGFYMSPEEAPAAAGLSEAQSAALDAVPRLRAAFEADHVQPLEMRWLGDSWLTRTRLPSIYVSTVRDGVIVRHESFVDEAEALAAAGVSP